MSVVVTGDGSTTDLSRVAGRTRIVVSAINPCLECNRTLIGSYTRGNASCISLANRTVFVGSVVSGCRRATRRDNTHVIGSYNFSSVPSSLNICFARRRTRTRFSDAYSIVRVHMGTTGNNLSNNAITSVTAVFRRMKGSGSHHGRITGPCLLGSSGSTPDIHRTGIDGPRCSGRRGH